MVATQLSTQFVPHILSLVLLEFIKEWLKRLPENRDSILSGLHFQVGCFISPIPVLGVLLLTADTFPP